MCNNVNVLLHGRLKGYVNNDTGKTRTKLKKPTPKKKKVNEGRNVNVPFVTEPTINEPFVNKPVVNESTINGPIVNKSTSGLDKFCDWDAETLAALLGDDDVLDIQPLSVDKSPIKPTESKPSDVKVFFGKQPKVCKNKPFKALGLSSPKPTCSELVSIKAKSRYKNADVAGAKRQSERLRTLKTKVVSGPGKKPDDPLVITEEDTTKMFFGGGRISKSWAKFCKGLT